MIDHLLRTAGHWSETDVRQKLIHQAARILGSEAPSAGSTASSACATSCTSRPASSSTRPSPRAWSATATARPTPRLESMRSTPKSARRRPRPILGPGAGQPSSGSQRQPPRPGPASTCRQQVPITRVPPGDTTSLRIALSEVQAACARNGAVSGPDTASGNLPSVFRNDTDRPQRPVSSPPSLSCRDAANLENSYDLSNVTRCLPTPPLGSRAPPLGSDGAVRSSRRTPMVNAQETNFEGVLEGKKQYQAPLYQRVYAWGKRQRDQLVGRHRRARAHATGRTDRHALHWLARAGSQPGHRGRRSAAVPRCGRSAATDHADNPARSSS